MPQRKQVISLCILPIRRREHLTLDTTHCTASILTFLWTNIRYDDFVISFFCFKYTSKLNKYKSSICTKLFLINKLCNYKQRCEYTWFILILFTRWFCRSKKTFQFTLVNFINQFSCKLIIKLHQIPTFLSKNKKNVSKPLSLSLSLTHTHTYY